MPTEIENCLSTFARLEAQRAEILSGLADSSPSQLRGQPAPGSWSAVEVIDHIVRAEAGTIAHLRAGLQHPYPLGSEERHNIAVLDRALRSNQHFKVPAGASDIYPDAQTTLPQVAARWEQARAELAVLLHNLSLGSVAAGVFCHPFAGWMTITEVLNHFYAHAFHHIFQLERLREHNAAAR